MLPDIDIKDKPRQTQYGVYGGQQEGSSTISDLAEFIFEEEDYPVIDYELVIHATKSTAIDEGKKPVVSRLDATLRNIIDTSTFKHLVVERYCHQQYHCTKMKKTAEHG
uniref:Uncharacterized protein n=1 Tax=Oryza sativa subsp. japonica TaxID=39947 RepID=Q6ZCD3_ORYSJ|nr:hypothetical protein [Oryza sativa Japonica Group]